MNLLQQAEQQDWLRLAPGVAYGVWLVAHDAARRYAMPRYGTEMVGGGPRWRSFTGLVTQLGALPLLLTRSYVGGGTMSDWCTRCHDAGLSQHDLELAYGARRRSNSGV